MYLIKKWYETVALNFQTAAKTFSPTARASAAKAQVHTETAYHATAATNKVIS